MRLCSTPSTQALATKSRRAALSHAASKAVCDFVACGFAANAYVDKTLDENVLYTYATV